MNEFGIGARMKEIILQKGMKNSDFYRDDNYGEDSETERITKTRFHRVLKGEIKHPGDDFIPKFCKIAGISIGEFYESADGPDEITYSLDEAEKHLILTIRRLKRKTGDEHICKYVESFLSGLDERK